MSLIKCPECGNEISDLAASCPQCGCPINSHTVPSLKQKPASSAQQPAPNAPAKKRAGATIAIVSVAILILAGAAAWFLFFRGGTDDDERRAYDAIMRYENAHQLDSLSEALNDYFDTYNSDAYHYSQLKGLHDRFFTERADWQAAEGILSIESVRHFLDVHPDGFFLKDAKQKLDSLSYKDAKEVNTREAFEHYLSQFPQGKYTAEARNLLSDLDSEELSVEEKASVKEALTAHFDALGDNDKEAIASTLADEISSYIGKSNPELEDIYAYMTNMHSSGRIIVFIVKNLNITKVDAAGRTIYNAQFSLDEEAYKRGHHSGLDTEAGEPTENTEEPAEVKHFSGTAVLNSSMKITSLVLRK